MRFEHRVAVIDDSGNEVGTMPIDEFTKITGAISREWPVLGPPESATPAAQNHAAPKATNGHAAPKQASRRRKSVSRCTSIMLSALAKENRPQRWTALACASGLFAGSLHPILKSALADGLVQKTLKPNRYGHLYSITDKGRSALAAAQGRLQ